MIKVYLDKPLHLDAVKRFPIRECGTNRFLGLTQQKQKIKGAVICTREGVPKK